MESIRLGDLVEYRCTGFIPIVVGALRNDVDLTFFLRNTTTVPNWINTLLTLSVDSNGQLTEHIIRDAGIPTLNLDELIKLANSPLQLPVLSHLSLDELKELNDMSLAILMYAVEHKNWRPDVRELVYDLGLDGLETKVCLYFINEVALANINTLIPPPQTERGRVIAKLTQFQQEENIREIELLSLCVKIEEGVWLTKHALISSKLADLNRIVTMTQLLEINPQIFSPIMR